MPGRHAIRLAGALAVAGAALAVAVAAASAPGQGPSVYFSRLLWATVNVCDTAAHPNTIGIRASMPGSGIPQERMFVRFQVQYLRPSDARWHNIGPGGDSGFIDIGSAKFRARRTGRNFVVEPPPTGGTFVLRGAVTFEWRRQGRLVRRARKRTTAGHPTRGGSDPPGFSAAACEIG